MNRRCDAMRSNSAQPLRRLAHGFLLASGFRLRLSVFGLPASGFRPRGFRLFHRLHFRTVVHAVRALRDDRLAGLQRRR